MSRLTTRFTLRDVRWALAATALLLTLVVCIDVLSDPDLWWHLKLGQGILDTGTIPTTEPFSYTATGNALTAHEWLTDATLAALNRTLGLLGVVLVVAILGWTAFWAITIRAMRRGATPLALAVGLILSAKAAEPVLGTRPQVLSVVLLAWTLVLAESVLDRPGRRAWALPPLFLLWANLHAGFLAGIGVLLALLVAVRIEAWYTSRPAPPGWRLLGVITALSATAACLNPAGPRLYAFAVQVSASESQKAITEWHSPDFHDAGLLALLVMLVTLVILPGLGARPRLRDALVAAAGVALALTAVRNTAVAVVLIAPVWIDMASQVGHQLSQRWPRLTAPRRPAAPLLVACLLGVGILVDSVPLVQAASQTEETAIAMSYPACAARYLANLGPQRVLAAYSDAGFLINRDAPQLTVYEYGESISLGNTVFADYLRIVSDAQDAPTARDLIDQSRTTAVLMNAPSLVADLETHGWKTVLVDHGRHLLLRASASAAPPSGC